jgi:uncharacterized protein (TIGR02677 family)
VHTLLRDLAGLLESLAANASAFMSGLQRTIELQDAMEDAFLAYKDQLIGYLERFIGDLQVKSGEIAQALRELDQLGVERLLELAAGREAGDAAPAMLGDDAEVEAALSAKCDIWQSRWSGLRAWFVGTRAHPSQAHLLRQRARAAIPDLLAVVVLLQERRAGRSDRTADFRALAVWFAEAPSEADAHRLWRVAFGLSSSRHLTADAAALSLVDSHSITTTTSWLEAEPVPISPRLRATGRYQRPGTIAQVVDRSAARSLLAEQLEAEHQQTLLARQRLATGRPMRLSDLGALDRAEFSLFLGLLGDTLAAASPASSEIDTLTSDGSLRVQLAPTADGVIAHIHTPDGVFSGTDHFITITDVGNIDAHVALRAGHR